MSSSNTNHHNNTNGGMTVMYYYYISGLMGMSRSGAFTRDKSRWMLFSSAEVERMTDGGIKPYGATKKGVFIIANQEAWRYFQSTASLRSRGTLPYTGGYVTTLRVVTEDDQVTEITLFSANEIKLNDETDT